LSQKILAKKNTNKLRQSEQNKQQQTIRTPYFHIGNKALGKNVVIYQYATGSE
jgi:hypothetical protein